MEKIGEKLDKIDVVSRKEAVDRAVTYLKSSKKPNVIPSTFNICFGLGGLAMVDAGADIPTDIVYFPVTRDDATEHPPQMTSVPTVDRLSVIGFFDFFHSGCFVDNNKAEHTCYLSNPGKETVAAIPAHLLNKFPSIRAVADCARETNNVFFGGLIDAIGERFSGDKREPEKSEKKETFVPSTPSTEYLFLPEKKKKARDIIDVVSFYDDHILLEQKLISYYDMEQQICLLASTGDGSVLEVSDMLYAKSKSVAAILDSVDKNWIIKSK